MAKLFITEYSELAVDKLGKPIQVGKEPSLRSSMVTFTAAANSDTFKRGTRFVRLIADADAHIEFGDAPAAVATSMKLEANVVEYFGIAQIKDLRLSVYDGSS